MNKRTVLEMIRGALPLILSVMIAHDNPGKRRAFFGLLVFDKKPTRKIKRERKRKEQKKMDKKAPAKRRMLTDKMSIDRYWK